MLVLSRRPNDRIVFPTLNLSIDVVRVRGKIVKLGIHAPKDVPVVRGELADEASLANQRRESSHVLRNQLNKVWLRLALLQQQLKTGENRAVEGALEQIVGELTEMEGLLDRDSASTKPPKVAGSSKSSPCPVAEAKLRTLVVEDEPNERELLAGILRMHGLEAQVASDGLEAIRYLDSNEPPDLIVLDMRMPRCDGIQTLRAIRGNPRLQKTKVFAVTGSSRQEVCRDPSSVDVDRWFEKPLNPAKLIKALHDSEN